MQITVNFQFCKGCDDEWVEEDFEVYGDLENELDTYASNWCDDKKLEDPDSDDWELSDLEVTDWDDESIDPSNFSSLNEYAEYVEKLEKHGEAYSARYADIGDFDFEDSYEGEWGSEEEFAENLFDMNYPDLDKGIRCYIDMELVTRDYLMDYSTYRIYGTVHVFRD